MAKLKSHIFSDMRGSAGGATYTRNASGHIVLRQRTIPKSSRSSNRSASISNLSTASKAWSALSDSQRLAWDKLALQGDNQSSLDKAAPTGRSLAIAQYSLSAKMYQFKASHIQGGPSMVAPNYTGNLALRFWKLRTWSGPTVGLIFTVDNPYDKYVASAVHVSFPLSSGSKYIPSKFDPALYQQKNSSGESVGNYYFSGLVPGRRYVFRIKCIDFLPGRKVSAVQFLSGVAG